MNLLKYPKGIENYIFGPIVHQRKGCHLDLPKISRVQFGHNPGLFYNLE